MASSQPARHTVAITQKDWPGSQKELDQEAADGYRLAGATITGMRTAEASFLRTDATAAALPVQTVAHDTFHEPVEGHQQAGGAGLSGFDGALLVLQANPTVIVEKATPAFKLRYQYIIKETARISSGESEVEKLQEQGVHINWRN